MVLTLLEIFYIGLLWPITKYWKSTTACLQHKPQTGCHKSYWNYFTSITTRKHLIRFDHLICFYVLYMF